MPTPETEIDALKRRLAAQEQALKAMQASLEQVSHERDQLRGQVSGMQNALASQGSMLGQAQAENGVLRGIAAAESQRRAEMEAVLVNRDQQIKDMQSHLQALGAELNASYGRIAGVQNVLGEVRLQLETEKAARAALEQEVAQKTERIKHLEDAVEGEPKIESVINCVRDSAHNVTQSGSKWGRRWQLSDIRMSLKASVSGDGTKVTFPKPGAPATSGGDLSTIDFTLKPTTVAEGEVPKADVVVPDLTGYSSLVAERKARALGLSVELSSQTVTPVSGQPSQEGRVVGQHPGPGEVVKRGTTIELFIGKNELLIGKK